MYTFVDIAQEQMQRLRQQQQSSKNSASPTPIAQQNVPQPIQCSVVPTIAGRSVDILTRSIELRREFRALDLDIKVPDEEFRNWLQSN